MTATQDWRRFCATAAVAQKITDNGDELLTVQVKMPDSPSNVVAANLVVRYPSPQRRGTAGFTLVRHFRDQTSRTYHDGRVALISALKSAQRGNPIPDEWTAIYAALHHAFGDDALVDARYGRLLRNPSALLEAAVGMGMVGPFTLELTSTSTAPREVVTTA